MNVVGQYDSERVKMNDTQQVVLFVWQNMLETTINSQAMVYDVMFR